MKFIQYLEMIEFESFFASFLKEPLTSKPLHHIANNYLFHHKSSPTRDTFCPVTSRRILDLEWMRIDTWALVQSPSRLSCLVPQHIELKPRSYSLFHLHLKTLWSTSRPRTSKTLFDSWLDMLRPLPFRQLQNSVIFHLISWFHTVRWMTLTFNVVNASPIVVESSGDPVGFIDDGRLKFSYSYVELGLEIQEQSSKIWNKKHWNAFEMIEWNCFSTRVDLLKVINEWNNFKCSKK